MKHLHFLFILFFISIKSFGQISLPIDNLTGNICYSDVVRIDSVNADMLYINALLWAAEYYASANESIQMQDKQFHVFMVKGSKIYTIRGLLGENIGEEYLHYTIKLETRDERFKFTITDFYFQVGTLTYPAENYIEEKKSNASKQEKIDRLAKSLISGITNSIKNQNSQIENDW